MTQSASSGLHVRHEKAGLIFDALPIPWNADAVIVEAAVKLPRSSAADKTPFRLQLSSGGPALPAEVLLTGKKDAPTRVFFRFPPPPRSCSLSIHWNEHALGSADIPILSAAEFVQGLTLQAPTIHVSLKGQATPCRACVKAQCQSLWASVLVSSPVALAPAADLDLRLAVCHDEMLVQSLPVVWTADMLRSRQTLVSVLLPKPRRTGVYHFTWELAGRPLSQHRLLLIAKKRFLRSLRITATRFIVQKTTGALEIVRALPQRDGKPDLTAIARVGPHFYVCSGEAGMAGLTSFTLTAVRDDAAEPTTLTQDEIIVTDGPTPILPATMAAQDLARIKHFALASSEGPLGVLPLVPAPAADFTGEGGFTPLEEFVWTAAAEEQLSDRLGKLLDED